MKQHLCRFRLSSPKVPKPYFWHSWIPTGRYRCCSSPCLRPCSKFWNKGYRTSWILSTNFMMKSNRSSSKRFFKASSYDWIFGSASRVRFHLRDPSENEINSYRAKLALYIIRNQSLFLRLQNTKFDRFLHFFPFVAFYSICIWWKKIVRIDLVVHEK